MPSRLIWADRSYQPEMMRGVDLVKRSLTFSRSSPNRGYATGRQRTRQQSPAGRVIKICLKAPRAVWRSRRQVFIIRTSRDTSLDDSTVHLSAGVAGACARESRRAVSDERAGSVRPIIGHLEGRIPRDPADGERIRRATL